MTTHKATPGLLTVREAAQMGLTREVVQELTQRVFEKGFKLDLDVQFPIATSPNKAIHFRNRKTPYSSAAKNLCLNGRLPNNLAKKCAQPNKSP